MKKYQCQAIERATRKIYTKKYYGFSQKSVISAFIYQLEQEGVDVHNIIVKCCEIN